MVPMTAGRESPPEATGFPATAAARTRLPGTKSMQMAVARIKRGQGNGVAMTPLRRLDGSRKAKLCAGARGKTVRLRSSLDRDSTVRSAPAGLFAPDVAGRGRGRRESIHRAWYGLKPTL